MAHWFAQVMHESSLFKSMREYGNVAYLTNYYEGRCRTPINRIVNGANATLSPLGNCNAGDGVRYSGKGLIQLTGGDNYRAYENYRKNGDFTTDPHPERLILEPLSACDAAGYYWASKQRFNNINGRLVRNGSLGINYWAERNSIVKIPIDSDLISIMKEVTKCINNNLDGQKKRIAHFKHCFKHLSEEV